MVVVYSSIGQRTRDRLLSGSSSLLQLPGVLSMVWTLPSLIHGSRRRGGNASACAWFQEYELGRFARTGGVWELLYQALALRQGCRAVPPRLDRGHHLLARPSVFHLLGGDRASRQQQHGETWPKESVAQCYAVSSCGEFPKCPNLKTSPLIFKIF